MTNLKTMYVKGKTQKGSSHINFNLPNQDFFRIIDTKNLKILVIADGVGSNKKSEKGSKSICNAVAYTFKLYKRHKIKEEEIINNIFIKYRRNIDKRDWTQVSTTCIFVVLISNFLYLGQIGDGVACIKKDDCFYHTNIDHDFMNEVKALSATNKSCKWTLKKLDISDMNELEIMLLTDGISEDICQDKLKEFMDFLFAKIDETKNSNEVLVDLIKEWESFSVDDKTIVLGRWQSDSYRR